MTDTSAAPAKSSKSNLRVLVVDDESKIVELIKKALEAHSYDVVTASSGEEALACACSRPLDVILLDVAMPMMDGFEVLARLKADRATSRIPVIMVTAKSDTRSIFQSMDLWALDYVVKPFTIDVLLEAVRRCTTPSLQ